MGYARYRLDNPLRLLTQTLKCDVKGQRPIKHRVNRVYTIRCGIRQLSPADRPGVYHEEGHFLKLVRISHRYELCQ